MSGLPEWKTIGDVAVVDMATMVGKDEVAQGNLALACLRCNAIKNNYFTKDEMLKIGGIIRAKRT